jgi:hypothetical protein
MARYNLTNLGGLHNTIALSEIDKRFLRELSLRGSAYAESTEYSTT